MIGSARKARTTFEHFTEEKLATPGGAAARGLPGGHQDPLPEPFRKSRSASWPSSLISEPNWCISFDRTEHKDDKESLASLRSTIHLSLRSLRKSLAPKPIGYLLLAI